MFVNEMKDGTDLDQVLIVRACERRAKRDGGDYLRVQLGDRTGSVVTMVWEAVPELEPLLSPGSPVRVRGRFVVHPRFGPQVNLRDISEPAPGSFEMEDLLDGPPRSAEHMEADLRELIGTVREPHLRELLERILADGAPSWDAYRLAPAAKFYHQAYRHGLLEHCLGVAQGVSALAATFPGIDRDVAVTGALLHDIGKLDAYSEDPHSIDLTDEGRLYGEIALGYYRIRREIEEIEGFPEELARGVLHIILSHHGSLEHGSPVVPCTREATLVHMIDNLGGRLGSFDRLEKELAPQQCWSAFDRGIGTGAFFGARTALEPDAQPARLHPARRAA